MVFQSLKTANQAGMVQTKTKEGEDLRDQMEELMDEIKDQQMQQNEMSQLFTDAVDSNMTDEDLLSELEHEIN